jgi:Zn2+/Cd2+-exporting ATPase
MANCGCSEDEPCIQEQTSRPRQLQADRSERFRVIFAALATVVGLIVPDSRISACSFVAAIVAGGSMILPRAVNAIACKRIDINVLMLIAVIGAIILGELAEAASIVSLFAFAELLERLSIGKVRSAIHNLLKLTPAEALMRIDGDFRAVPTSEVRIGALVLVRPGMLVPLDGSVIAGSSSIDQSNITGESLPVEKQKGDLVYGGTLNCDGALEISVTSDYKSGLAARIVKAVEQARLDRAVIERAIDSFAGYYTPVVVVLAFLVFSVPPLLFGSAWADSAYRALVLLVISCPCALVISTPVSVISGITALARHGVLVRGGRQLEALGKLRAIAFDKTGTITETRLTVVAAKRFADDGSLESSESKYLIKVAASLAVNSHHPVSQSIVNYAKGLDVRVEPVGEFQNLRGLGVAGDMGGERYLLGSERLFEISQNEKLKIEQLLAELNHPSSIVLVGRDRTGQLAAGEPLAVFAAAQIVRSDAAACISKLREIGVTQIAILSGDRTASVQQVASSIGAETAQGDLLPDEKVTALRELAKRYGAIGMVGDGVNDSPALAAANVGIAMGRSGSAAAIEIADVVLLRDELELLALTIKLCRRALGIINANIVLAVSTKLVVLVLAVLGLTSMWLALLADTGITVIVVLNGLRLLSERNTR